ncbi:MAG: hypothetical protein DRP81_08195 [Candidatus Omnitrophota bacterium]|nr:MAG: hypothetical protein DRP81_08195 [Candidatus Omnitrophota bacterium]
MKKGYLGTGVLILIIMFIGLVLRDLPFLKYGFLYGVDSVGHFWFSKMIIDSGQLFPQYITISFQGDTGWCTGYAAWTGFHILEAITSIVTGIPLEKLFLNLTALLSMLSILPIYLAFRRDLKNKYQKLGLVILCSFWFYFIFGQAWLGTYENFGFLLFVLVIYIVESGLEKRNGGKIFILIFLTLLLITHSLSVLATLLYLIFAFMIKKRDSLLAYISYLVVLTLIIGNLYESKDIPYIGLYILKYKLFLIPLFLFFLRWFWGKIGRIEDIIQKLLLKIENSNLKWYFAILWILSVPLLLVFGEKLKFVHYIFLPIFSFLFAKYFIFFTPIILIMIYLIFSKSSNFYKDLIYIVGISFGFFAAGIFLNRAFIFIRVLGFISLFVIGIVSSFPNNKRKLFALFAASLLMVAPVIPSYFYSEKIDRPYYPIAEEYCHTVKNIPIKCKAEEDVLLKEKAIISRETVLDTLLKIYENRGNKYICDVENSKFYIRDGKNVIYQSDFNAIEFYKVPHPGVI